MTGKCWETSQKERTLTKIATDVKVSIAQARAIALKAHPGNIADVELEREAGGTGLNYSFNIKRDTITQEVGVDARTGAYWRMPKTARILTKKRLTQYRLESILFLESNRLDPAPEEGLSYE